MRGKAVMGVTVGRAIPALSALLMTWTDSIISREVFRMFVEELVALVQLLGYSDAGCVVLRHALVSTSSTPKTLMSVVFTLLPGDLGTGSIVLRPVSMLSTLKTFSPRG